MHDDSIEVALKVYREGPNYEGALQREQYMMQVLAEKRYNVATSYDCFVYRGLNVQVMELLDANVRQLIFRNRRSGLSPWVMQKFATDILA